MSYFQIGCVTAVFLGFATGCSTGEGAGGAGGSDDTAKCNALRANLPLDGFDTNMLMHMHGGTGGAMSMDMSMQECILGSGHTADVNAAGDPVVGPKVIDWFNRHGWGLAHERWHDERLYDGGGMTGAAGYDAAGYHKAKIQIWQDGSGLEFLAMHRHMIQRMKWTFPDATAQFEGWDPLPTDPHDPRATLPNMGNSSWSKSMLDAIDIMENHLDTFKSDDEFGRWLQVSDLQNPDGSHGNSNDPTAGFHAAAHIRWVNSKSEQSMGIGTRNIENRWFYGLHGYIDARWSALRTLLGKTNQDADYVALMKAQADEMDKDGAEQNARQEQGLQVVP